MRAIWQERGSRARERVNARAIRVPAVAESAAPGALMRASPGTVSTYAFAFDFPHAHLPAAISTYAFD